MTTEQQPPEHAIPLVSPAYLPLQTTVDNKGDTLGDRMKGFENFYRTYIRMREPIIIRVDGKAFHTLSANFDKPYDYDLIHIMDNVAIALCEQIQGAVFAYVQSDEISVFVYPWLNPNSEPWFQNNINKIVSVSAGIASAHFTSEMGWKLFGYEMAMQPVKPVVFDSRAFTLPMDEVNNYFIWRQKDWLRNSVQMHARSLYSQKQLNGKKLPELLQMIEDKGENWNDNCSGVRHGRGIAKSYDYKVVEETGESVERSHWTVCHELPKFTEDREFISKLLDRHLLGKQ